MPIRGHFSFFLTYGTTYEFVTVSEDVTETEREILDRGGVLKNSGHVMRGRERLSRQHVNAHSDFINSVSGATGRGPQHARHSRAPPDDGLVDV